MRNRFILGRYEGYHPQVEAWFSYFRIFGCVAGVAIPHAVGQLTLFTRGQHALIKFSLRISINLNLYGISNTK